MGKNHIVSAPHRSVIYLHRTCRSGRQKDEARVLHTALFILLPSGMTRDSNLKI